ncbi:hypothetical protein EXIGLDRAFT_735930 [Exidia glandulosa HHB12029]|uniref:Uncharacterized protein n=1 Tax=Exidia glandulosa HHB12029 TaxID=1314781 RepID=A0A166NDN3_EXIGL|nr:hypothetical protein EXIGLDRAFT_735930 [Exidia glandulosa HHB12029]
MSYEGHLNYLLAPQIDGGSIGCCGCGGSISEAGTSCRCEVSDDCGDGRKYPSECYGGISSF